MFFDAVELGQAALGKTPEGFNAVDVDAAFGKGLGFVDADMFVVADVDQAVIAAPGIGEDHAGRIDLAPQRPLESVGRTVRDDFGVDTPLTFIDAEHRLLEGAATASARAGTPAQSGRTEVTFIGLDDPNEKAQLGELMDKNHLAKKGVVAINRVAIEPQEHRGFGRLDVQTKTLDEFQKPMSAQLAPFD